MTTKREQCDGCGDDHKALDAYRNMHGFIMLLCRSCGREAVDNGAASCADRRPLRVKRAESMCCDETAHYRCEG